MSIPPGKPPHHHRRRYHYPREALGYGYERFDFVLPDALKRTNPRLVKQLQTEALNEQEAAHERARNGIWVCASILLFLLLGLQFSWLFFKYMQAVLQCFGFGE